MEQKEVLEQTNEISYKKKIPNSIIAICILGLIGVGFTIPLIFNDFSEQLGSWYQFYLGLSTVIVSVCLIGLLKMKKWAVYTYIGIAALNLIVFAIIGGGWNIGSIVFPVIVISVALTNINKMD